MDAVLLGVFLGDRLGKAKESQPETNKSQGRAIGKAKESQCEPPAKAKKSQAKPRLRWAGGRHPARRPTALSDVPSIACP
jgi:hypothetical protein